MSIETALQFLLLVSAATWFGGSVVGALLGGRIAQADDARALGRFAKEYVQVAPTVFGGAGFLSLVAGIWLVATRDDLGFTTPWVLVCLVLWFVSIVFAAAVVGSAWFRVAEALGHAEGRGARTPAVTSAAARQLAERALRVSWVDVGLRLVVALLVVWQPA